MTTELNFSDLATKRAKRPAQISAMEIKADAVVYLAALSPDECDLLQSQWTGYQEEYGLEGSNVGFRKFVVAWGLSDSQNNRLLDPGDEAFCVTDEFIEAMDNLAENMPLKTISRVFGVACDKYHLTKEDIEELVKNSEATDSADGSGSKPKPADSDENNGSETLTDQTN